MGLIADCQLDEEEMTQFNIHLSCVIIGSLLSCARHPPLINPLRSLSFKRVFIFLALVPSITPTYIHVLTAEENRVVAGRKEQGQKKEFALFLLFLTIQWK